MVNYYKKYKKIYNKYILNNDFIFFNLLRFLSIIFYLYFKFVLLTSKIDYQIHESNKGNLKNSNTIVAFWHGRLLSPLIIRKYFAKAYVLISLSRSAYLIKLLATLFRVNLIEGSSNRNGKDKGGRESIKKILQILKDKNTALALAPDGSIGPRMRCASGLPSIALLSKLNIIPLTYSAKRLFIIKSWDRLIIPLPFNQITIKLDKPISYEQNKLPKTNEKLRVEIENKLNEITWELDQKYNHPKIFPEDTGRRGIVVKTKNH